MNEEINRYLGTKTLEEVVRDWQTVNNIKQVLVNRQIKLMKLIGELEEMGRYAEAAAFQQTIDEISKELNMYL